MKKLELQNFEDVLVNNTRVELSNAYCYGQITRFIEEGCTEPDTTVYELIMPKYTNSCVLSGVFTSGVLTMESTVEDIGFSLYRLREDIEDSHNTTDGYALEFDFFVFDTVKEGLQWFYDNTLLKEKV